MEQTATPPTAPQASAPGAAIVATSAATPKSRAFRFGEPEAVLDRREFLMHAEARWNGRWYEPPVPMASLARVRFMSPHHASALKYKVNQLVRFFQPTSWLSRTDFAELALNFLSTGNGYLERRDNLAGRPLTLKNTPSLYVRRGKDDAYFWVPGGWNVETPFRPDSIVHLREADLTQELYGLPEYLSALQSGLLNESATIFRRRYYANGSHMGYILSVTDANLADEDADAIEEAMAKGKGAGNFKSLFLHMPGGAKDGVQVIPVGDAAAKDEFLGIKNTTRDDVLAAHRVYPVLLGIVPQNAGGLGDPAKAADVHHFAEIEPLQGRFLEINDQLGVEAVRFRAYERQAVAPAASAAQA